MLLAVLMLACRPEPKAGDSGAEAITREEPVAAVTLEVESERKPDGTRVEEITPDFDTGAADGPSSPN